MINDAKKLYKGLLAICMSSLEKSLFEYFSFFFSTFFKKITEL